MRSNSFKISLPTIHSRTNIYSHPQIDCFVLSELFSVARRVGRSKPGSKPSNFTLELVSDHSANKRTTLAKGIFKVSM